ncbi:MAG: esterase/lipase family protein, partial [Candidatus Sumerlaeaceae bacterium]
MSRDCANEVVVLLHGLGRTPLDTWVLANAAKREGYKVLNWAYPSTRYGIDKLSDMLSREILRFHEADAIHFVGHSLGGLVERRLLATAPPPNAGRLVMIGSPNAGAWIAETLGDLWLFKKLFGPVGQELRRGPRGQCTLLGKPHSEFGIIAGGTGRTRGMNPFLPGDNDCTVTVAETWLEGAADFIVLPYP